LRRGNLTALIRSTGKGPKKKVNGKEKRFSVRILAGRVEIEESKKNEKTQTVRRTAGQIRGGKAFSSEGMGDLGNDHYIRPPKADQDWIRRFLPKNQKPKDLTTPNLTGL